MKNRYEWNNTKELSSERLYEEFVKSSLQNKLIIFRILSITRRKILRKEWNKQLKKQQNNNLLEKTAFILSPLKEWLIFENNIIDSEIKNGDELMLIYEMIHFIKIDSLKIETVKDIKAEEESFKRAKQKMIEFINIMEQREKGVFTLTSENPLISQLEAINYKPLTKEMNIRLAKRDIYLKMMKHIGIGKDRAKRLMGVLERYKHERDNLNNEDKQLYDKEFIILDSQIPNDYKVNSQNYFFNVFKYTQQHP